MTEYNVAQTCIRDTFFLQPVGDLMDATGGRLTIAAGTDLTVSGTFLSTAADGPCPARDMPPPPPPTPPIGGAGGAGGASGSGGGPTVKSPDGSCPADHMCVVNTTVSATLVPNACALMPNGFPITCVDANDCFAAGFDASTLCIGQILAYPDNYCFQSCNP